MAHHSYYTPTEYTSDPSWLSECIVDYGQGQHLSFLSWAQKVCLMLVDLG